jgi:hypothetical protein
MKKSFIFETKKGEKKPFIRAKREQKVICDKNWDFLVVRTRSVGIGFSGLRCHWPPMSDVKAVGAEVCGDSRVARYAN